MLSALPVTPATIPGTLTWASTPHGQCHHRYQTRSRQQVRGYRTSRGSSPGMQEPHLRGVLSARERGSFRNSHRPSSEDTFRVDAPGCTAIYAVDRGSVSRGLATGDVRDFAGDLGIHSDSPAGVLDGQ
jgi:hypothetical protein